MTGAALAAVLGCASPTPTCEPYRCPVWSLAEIQARASLRKDLNCDAASLDVNPQACDYRWMMMEGAMSRVGVHCDAVDRMGGGVPAEVAPCEGGLRCWWRNLWE